MKKLLIIIIFILFSSSAYALNVTANSGSAQDIQAAIDQVEATGGGNVFIPAGNWSFDLNTSKTYLGGYYGVKIPGGVNIIGAGANKTILRMSMETAPDTTSIQKGIMFVVDGRQNYPAPVRISGIKFVGYVDYSKPGGDDNITQAEWSGTSGILIEATIDFRVDHCTFEDFTTSSISTRRGGSVVYECRGVIDHCTFFYPYKEQVVGTKWGYGIIVSGISSQWTDPDMVYGKYEDGISVTYIEDCYFKDCRHHTDSNGAGYYVVRNCTFKKTIPETYGGVNSHEGNPGSFLREIYNNTMEDEPCGDTFGPGYEGRYMGNAVCFRGGKGVVWGNTFKHHREGISIMHYNETLIDSEYQPKDIYIWNNTFNDVENIITTNDPDNVIENTTYFLYEKPNYQPYLYPHPLTLGETPEPPTITYNSIFGKLKDKNDNPVSASIIIYEEGNETIVNSMQTNSTGHYTLNLQEGIYDVKFDLTNFYIPGYSIRLKSVNVSEDVQDLIKHVTDNSSEEKVSFIVDTIDTETIKIYSEEEPSSVKMNGTRVQSWSYDEINNILTINLSVVIANSGSVEDIQDAIDQVVTAGGGIVYIPEGNWTFNANDSYRVEFEVPPGGINIIGAGKNKTILQMPIDDSVSGTSMFRIAGGHKSETGWVSGGKLRITGITFKGRPNWQTSPTVDVGITVQCAKDFRIDHCDFYWMGGQGIGISDSSLTYGIYGGDPDMVSQGVIDHCNFYNIFKPAALEHGGYAYGVVVARAYHYKWTLWEPDIWEFFGKYNRNVFVEDCYFYNCRHATNVYCGGIMVFRNNTVMSNISGRAFHMLDLHPTRGSGDTGVYSGRGFEIYDVDVYAPFRPNDGPTHRISGSDFAGGSGLIYNTQFENLTRGVHFEGPEGDPEGYEKTRQKEWFIWNVQCVNCGRSNVSTFDNGYGLPIEWNGTGEEPISWYALADPTTSPWGHSYSPYPYPHPLTLET